LSLRDPYVVLGVPVDADADVVAAAYRALARRFHPDVSREPDTERQMAEVNAAWTILRDPVRRAQWDAAHHPNVKRQPRQAESVQRTREPASPPPARPIPPHPAPRATTEAGWRRGPHGEGAAGPPPGPRSGSVLPFGRHVGWSIGEIVRHDPGYLVWLKDRREGEPYRAEIERVLGGMFPGGTAAAAQAQRRRRGLFG